MAGMVRYSIDDVDWIDPKVKQFLLDTCPFPQTLPHLSWSAMREHFLETIDAKTFIYFFTRPDSDLIPLAYCLVENW